MKEWKSINVDPPNKNVEVRDKKGNTAIAHPTYYPFKIINKEVIRCEPYLDGAWMIHSHTIEPLKINGIIEWREINHKES